jgi:bifunctional ADP-heptose synthase (sugar kinase/adenylyltransferase)
MIVVIGDLLQDIDGFYERVNTKDGYPILRLKKCDTRPGGAGAVAEMVRSLGWPCQLVCDRGRSSVKRRIIADGAVVCRVDEDCAGEFFGPLPEADVVLVADYGKGVVTESSWAAIVERYDGRPIIVDPHHTKPMEFYDGATVIKSSHGVHPNIPTIHTMGDGGLELLAGERHTFPAVSVAAVDPCGAGDMVLATVGVAIAMGSSLVEACEWAVKTSAVTCTKWGAVA